LYNLISIVDFPTRLTVTSATAIDKVFIDVSWFHDCVVSPFPNGLSDHDTQILTFSARYPKQPICIKTVRKVDQQKISDFLLHLSNESWSTVFNTEDVNLMLNSFLDTYLKIFNTSFPLTKVINQNKGNLWITPGILTSCKRKRDCF